MARELEHASPTEIIEWAAATFRPRLVMACSFGGPTGMVLLDMAMRVEPTIPVYFLDTGLLFAETHALIERVRSRYGINPIAVRPAQSVSEQAQTHGEKLWLRDPNACCHLRKVEPQAHFLRDYDAWISGLRRDQSVTRDHTEIVEHDARFGLTKICPLAMWTERMVWTYVRTHDVPYNELHDRGYPSAGCTPCTRAIAAGEDVRAGRWPGFAKVECGLHVDASDGERI